MKSFTLGIVLKKVLAIILLIITFVSFFPALNNGFVDWDDEANFVENENYRGFSWKNVKWMFTTFHLGHYQPLSWLTFAVDYTLWDMNPLGYHLTNLIIHLANTVFLFLLIIKFL